MILRFIIWSIVFTMIARFIFRFVLPVFNITRTAHSKISQMQKQMEDMQRAQNAQAESMRKKPKHVEGDFIDYEEVK